VPREKALNTRGSFTWHSLTPASGFQPLGSLLMAVIYWAA
jgi:hypothetical protein